MTFIIGTPHARGAGSLDMRTGGHSSKHVEDDVQCCPHCQSVVRLSAVKKDPHGYGFCGKCQKVLCNNQDCMKRTAELGCVPFTQQLEREWEQQGKLDHFRKLAGLDSSPPASQVITATR